MKMEQCVPKRRHIKVRRREITQKKECIIYNKCLKFVIKQTELILYTSTQHGTWAKFNPRPCFEGVTKATEHHISEQPVCVPIFEIWTFEIRAGMLAAQPCFKVLISYLPRGTEDFDVNKHIDQFNSTGNKSKK